MFDRMEGVSFWERYWSEKEKAYRRLDTEEFLREEAGEKLHYLQKGGSLLEFGCGRGELLVYYTREFAEVVACDPSFSRLEAARERLDRYSCVNSTLIHADDKSLWKKLDQNFDRIAVSPAVQYFDPGRLDLFIRQSLMKLRGGGRIILFDLIDPRMYGLAKLGIIQPVDSTYKASLFSILRATLKSLGRAGRNYLKKSIGHGPAMADAILRPADMITAVANDGVRAECRRSMYCEYKYHLILQKDQNAKVE